MFEVVKEVARKHAIFTSPSTSHAFGESDRERIRYVRSGLQRWRFPMGCISSLSTKKLLSATFLHLLLCTVTSSSVMVRKSACEESKDCNKYECDKGKPLKPSLLDQIMIIAGIVTLAIINGRS
ncbi:hypothetical protein Tcan_14143 [Toxocara canis]|uniref:Uncharacterized protein n=1 Tax=Toxocara canis TaxID=6265 RepID=A0A0B2V0C9_TOXCA|nr:hypothetical protein Tcan_14143 [Toxocara canis]